MFFAQSPPKLSTFWKIVTKDKRFMGRSSGVAENYTPCASQMKQVFTRLRGCRHQDYRFCCSKSIEFPEVWKDKTKMQGNKLNRTVKLNFILRNLLWWTERYRVGFWILRWMFCYFAFAVHLQALSIKCFVSNSMQLSLLWHLVAFCSYRNGIAYFLYFRDRKLTKSAVFSHLFPTELSIAAEKF